jgi:hypothetical protein
MKMAKNPFHQLDVIRNASRKQFIITDCYRLMYKEELWLHAYQTLYPYRKGESSEVRSIIEQLRAGTFRLERGRDLQIQLVQEVIRMILESIFYEASQKLTNHTVLATIKDTWQELTWCIKGSIPNILKQLNHSLFMKLLATKIKDKRFLSIVKKVLTYSIVDREIVENVFGGIGRNDSLSFLLVNIYLYEFDLWIAKYFQQEKTLVNRVKYIRYSDRFVIGVDGTNRQVIEMRKKIHYFLRNNLRMNLPNEHLCITHLEQLNSFLGYTFRKVKQCYNRNKQTMSNDNLQLYAICLEIPKTTINKYAQKHHYGDVASFTSRHRTRLINRSELEIVRIYNAELRKIATYYTLATNNHDFRKLFYLAESSFIKTIATKRKSTARKVALSMRKHRQGRLCIISRDDGQLHVFIRFKDVRR